MLTLRVEHGTQSLKRAPKIKAGHSISEYAFKSRF